VTYAYDIADKLTRETEGETETTYLYDANSSLVNENPPLLVAGCLYFSSSGV